VDRKIKRLLLIDRVDGLTRNWWPERNTYKIEHDPIIDQKISGHRNANRLQHRISSRVQHEPCF